MTRTVMASLLLEQAAYENAHGLGHRKLLVANTYLHRLLRPASALPTSALEQLDQIADGGEVPPQAARSVLDLLEGAAHVHS